jgi:3-deoxy-D-manno-octulosonic-acid transferase
MLIYNLAVKVYGLSIRLASFRTAKAAQWVRGRKNWRGSLRAKMAALGNFKTIWVHCASYGEFEQGRPVIEGLKQKYPQHRIILTFFSPSGYEPFKDWQGADLISYLPLDNKTNARDFLEIIHPSVAVFIKYEFWLYYLRELRRRDVPTYLVSAVFKPHHPFFKWYGAIFRKSLNTFNTLFIQDERSGDLLQEIGITNFEVCGDTRFDRVMQIRKNYRAIPEIERFRGNSRLLVAGSTWPQDEELVLDAIASVTDPVKLLLVPHNIGEKFIQATIDKLQARKLSYSLYSNGINNGSKVLVLNTMGMLSRTYNYGDVAYIGGGFNGGLHNCLEPAVYGIPVMFYGEDYVKYNEAVDLLNMGAGFRVQNATDIQNIINSLLADPARMAVIRGELENYFRRNANNAGKIIERIRI